MKSINGSAKTKAIHKAASLTRTAVLIFDKSKTKEKVALCSEAMNLLSDFLSTGEDHKVDPDIVLHIINTKSVMGQPKLAREYAQILSHQNQDDVMLKILSTIEYNGGMIEFDTDALWSVMQKTSRDHFAAAMMKIGNQYHDVGEFSHAKLVYITLAAFDAKNPNLHFRIAQIDLFLGRYDSADDYAFKAKALCDGEEPMATAINKLLHEIHLNILKYDPNHPDLSLDDDSLEDQLFGDDMDGPDSPAP
jgi:hypothetical protein